VNEMKNEMKNETCIRDIIVQDVGENEATLQSESTPAIHSDDVATIG
jgi:hypothetical protein